MNASQRYYQKNKERINARILKRYYNNKEEYQAKQKIYRRKHVISQGNKKSIYGVIKALYPIDGLCQGCGKLPNRLEYHHYDNTDYSDGNYFCRQCHSVIESLTRRSMLMALLVDRMIKGKPPFNR